MVRKGPGATRVGPFRLKPGVEIDIDSDTNVYSKVDPDLNEEEETIKPETADLKYTFDSASGYSQIEGINGAILHFPLESLCHKISG